MSHHTITRDESMAMRYTIEFNDVPVQIDFTAEPDLGDRCYDAPGTYADGPYEITFSITQLTDTSLQFDWQLRRRDDQPFDLVEAKITAAVPGIDLHRVFVPVLHDAIGKLDLISLPWSVEERTFTTWSFPFIAALNRFDHTRFCMGVLDHVHTAETRHSCYDEDAQMAIHRAPRTTDLWRETLYLSRTDEHVLDSVRAFSRAYDRVHNVALPTPPPPVWEPVWCSWYGIKNDVDADYIRSMVPLLKEWGVGNIIVDAGWFKSDGFDLNTGHYVLDEDKFPDMAALVQEVQAQGLTILLWCSPLFNLGGLGAVPFIQQHRFHPAGRDTPEDFLCPRCPEVRDYVRRTVRHLMETYGCNGLKIDMIDPLMDRAAQPCIADHEHDIDDYGEAIRSLLQDIYQTVTDVRKDALLEYRMNYSTLATRPFATSHRAQDAPFDPDHIRRMCIRLKSYMLDPAAGRSGNVAVHTDPAYWLPEESVENVGRFMASLAVSAVPMLSMDLRALPDAHGRIVRAWLDFYRRHRDLLLFGQQHILSADPHHSLFSLYRDDQALWGIFTPTVPGLLTAPDPNVRSMWVLNGSAQPRLRTRIENLSAQQVEIHLYDRSLNNVSTVQQTVCDRAVDIDLEVEIGGALALAIPD